MPVSLPTPNKYCQTELLLVSSARLRVNLHSNCVWFQGWLHFIKAHFIKGFGTKTLYGSMVLVGSDIHTIVSIGDSGTSDKLWLRGRDRSAV